MKSGIIAVAATVSMTLAPAVHGSQGGSGALSLSPSAAAHGSLLAFKLSAVIFGSVLEVLDDDDASADRTGFRLVEAVVERGSEFALTSVRHSGDSTFLSFRALLGGEVASPGAADQSVRFTFEMDRASFAASVAGSVAASAAIAAGSKVAVAPAALTAGSMERVIGYAIAMASDPSTVFCVVLNETGRHLYAGGG